MIILLPDMSSAVERASHMGVVICAHVGKRDVFLHHKTTGLGTIVRKLERFYFRCLIGDVCSVAQ